jgi:hypothetical protein
MALAWWPLRAAQERPFKPTMCSLKPIVSRSSHGAIIRMLNGELKKNLVGRPIVIAPAKDVHLLLEKA